MATRRILVVDDEIYIAHILDFSLGMEGYEAVIALDGVQALERVKESRPDLIILDADMPRMDGYEVCRALKADNDTEDIPVILLSPRSRDIDGQRAFEAGAEHFMTKPFSPRKLVDHVTAILDAKGQATS